MKQYEIKDLKIGETDLEIWGTFHKGESGSHFQPAISNRFEINYIYHDGNNITDKIEDYIKNPVNPDDFPNDLASYLDNDFMDLLETKILDKW